MEQYLWIIWLAVFALSVIIEASGPNLVSIWFAVGSLVTLINSFIPGVAWWIEVIVFVVISAVSFIALRPLFRKLLKHNIFDTNIDSYTGKKGYVKKALEPLNAVGTCSRKIYHIGSDYREYYHLALGT